MLAMKCTHCQQQPNRFVRGPCAMRFKIVVKQLVATDIWKVISGLFLDLRIYFEHQLIWQWLVSVSCVMTTIQIARTKGKTTCCCSKRAIGCYQYGKRDINSLRSRHHWNRRSFWAHTTRLSNRNACGLLRRRRSIRIVRTNTDWRHSNVFLLMTIHIRFRYSISIELARCISSGKNLPIFNGIAEKWHEHIQRTKQQPNFPCASVVHCIRPCKCL